MSESSIHLLMGNEYLQGLMNIHITISLIQLIQKKILKWFLCRKIGEIRDGGCRRLPELARRRRSRRDGFRGISP